MCFKVGDNGSEISCNGVTISGDQNQTPIGFTLVEDPYGVGG